jgi:hypothetical protein
MEEYGCSQEIQVLITRRRTFQLAMCTTAGSLMSKHFGTPSKDLKQCLIYSRGLPLMLLDGHNDNTSFRHWITPGNQSITPIHPVVDPYCTKSIRRYAILVHQPMNTESLKIRFFNTLLTLKKHMGIPIIPLCVFHNMTADVLDKIMIPDSTPSIETAAKIKAWVSDFAPRVSKKYMKTALVTARIHSTALDRTNAINVRVTAKVSSTALDRTKTIKTYKTKPNVGQKHLNIMDTITETSVVNPNITDTAFVAHPRCCSIY